MIAVDVDCDVRKRTAICTRPPPTNIILIIVRVGVCGVCMWGG